MHIENLSEDPDRDFYDAQYREKEEYFVCIDQPGEHAGGGTTCYFWFSSPAQLLNSIKNHMDFWEWSDGWADAAEHLAKIIEWHATENTLTDDLLTQLDAYVYEHAGIIILKWGTLKELFSGNDSFFREARRDFREQFDADENKPNRDATRSIGKRQQEAFIEYLCGMPN
jgi:hypothetical protein